MELQQAFEASVRQMFAQGKPAQNDKGVCMYRGPNGTKCAVGALIPDEAYSEDMEQNILSVLVEIDEFSAVLPPILLENVTFFQGLQHIHDDELNWVNSEVLSNALIDFGSVHGLSVEFIDGLYFGQDK